MASLREAGYPWLYSGVITTTPSTSPIRRASPGTPSPPPPPRSKESLSSSTRAGFGQIDHVHVHVVPLPYLADEPGSDLVGEAAGAGAADEDADLEGDGLVSAVMSGAV